MSVSKSDTLSVLRSVHNCRKPPRTQQALLCTTVMDHEAICFWQENTSSTLRLSVTHASVTFVLREETPQNRCWADLLVCVWGP